MEKRSSDVLVTPELRRLAKEILDVNNFQKLSVRFRSPWQGSVKADGLAYSAFQVLMGIKSSSKAPDTARAELQRLGSAFVQGGRLPTTQRAQYNFIVDILNNPQYNAYKALGDFSSAVKSVVEEASLPPDDSCLTQYTTFASKYLAALEGTFLPEFLQWNGVANCSAQTSAFLKRLCPCNQAEDRPQAAGEEQAEPEPLQRCEEIWQECEVLNFAVTAVNSLQGALVPLRANKDFSQETSDRLNIWRLVIQMQYDLMDPEGAVSPVGAEVIDDIADLWKRWAQLPCVHYADPRAMQILSNCDGPDPVTTLGLLLRGHSIEHMIMSFLSIMLAELNEASRAQLLSRFETLKGMLPGGASVLLQKFAAWKHALHIK